MYVGITLIYMTVSLVQAAVPSSRGRSSCQVWPDMAVQPGYVWRERCRNCTCVLGEGNVCDGPTCAVPYHPSHEQVCAKWSEDGCCCEQLGCLKHGRVYSIGESYPRSLSRPCITCPCVAAQRRPSCTAQQCQEECVDAIRVEGVCCPVCRNGPNCQLPHSMMTSAGNHAPIPLNSSSLVVDPNNTSRAWNCQCTVRGGYAKCTEIDNLIRQPLMELLRRWAQTGNNIHR